MGGETGYVESMLFDPRIGLKPLIGLCRRTSISLAAGVDARKVWAREAEHASGHLRRHLLDVSEAINQGQSIAEGLELAGDYFPSLVRELIVVGEQSGHLDAVLARLADHYESQLAMRRSFWAAITVPLVQLAIGVVVVGCLIWCLQFLPLDILGFGLVGNSGLTIYSVIVAAAVGSVWLVARAISRGLVWTAPVQRFVLQIPVLGKPLETLALARLAWSMHVTMFAGMEIRQALRLSLRSTQNARYIDHIPVIEAEVTAGNSIHDAFVRAGGYPNDFLDTLAVGEQSGEVVESMERLARQYQEQARSALHVLTVLAGWAVWAAIAALMIFMIFRLFFVYLGQLQAAAAG